MMFIFLLSKTSVTDNFFRWNFSRWRCN